MNNFLKNRLEDRLKNFPQATYPAHSRIHPLKSFDTSETVYYVKRDDELGFGISGSKIRKYRSLIPFLLVERYLDVIVIGSVNSNHVLSICQLLIENRISPHLFLRGDPVRNLQGNGLLLSQFISGDSIRWIKKNEWKNVEKQAQDYSSTLPSKSFIMKEGGSVKEALPGALTLSLDILYNEKENNCLFDHIFIDAGTGLMAIALILAFSWMKKACVIHVVLIAGSEHEFLNQLQIFHREFEMMMQSSLPFPANFAIHYPECRFGKINTSLFKAIAHLAKTEGFLTDPIYTIKLFNTAKCVGKDLKGTILVNHSGGALNLLGFSDKLVE